jgi:S-DNA-T family DNA segregation ATPase FtsK/SpoIIIE
MKEKNEFGKTLNALPPVKFFENVLLVIKDPIVEIYYDIKNGLLPWEDCISFSIMSCLTILMRWDLWVFKKLHVERIYPYSRKMFFIYWSISCLSGFYLWGLRKLISKKELVQRLTEVFINAGLKSPRGNLPNFVFDKPIDSVTRILRLTKSGLTFSDFIAKREHLSSGLRVEIDEVRDNLTDGAVDIIYSHFKMPARFDIKLIDDLPSLGLLIGKSRSKTITSSFAEIPHILIAGTTGGGKSTALRQMILTLYLREPKATMTLVDLKGGLEFSLFDKLPRVNVLANMDKAHAALKELEQYMDYRMELFRLNQCKDIQAFIEIAVDRKKFPERLIEKTEIARRYLVIDEAAQMFMAGDSRSIGNVQEVRRIVNRIAAQGRALGMHLIIATQRPDVKSLDPQTKANLPGILCFHMPNLASSLTVIGSGRAEHLAVSSGRALWKHGSQMVEVQTPFIDYKDAENLLKQYTKEEK